MTQARRKALKLIYGSHDEDVISPYGKFSQRSVLQKTGRLRSNNLGYIKVKHSNALNQNTLRGVSSSSISQKNIPLLSSMLTDAAVADNEPDELPRVPRVSVCTRQAKDSKQSTAQNEYMLFVKSKTSADANSVRSSSYEHGGSNELMSISPLNSSHMLVFDQNFKKHKKRLLPIDRLLPAIENKALRKSSSNDGEMRTTNARMTPERMTSLAMTLVENMSN